MKKSKITKRVKRNNSKGKTPCRQKSKEKYYSIDLNCNRDLDCKCETCKAKRQYWTDY